jgi:hypothetical protein
MPTDQRVRLNDGQDRAPFEESRELSQCEANGIGSSTRLLLSLNVKPELFAQKQILGSSAVDDRRLRQKKVSASKKTPKTQRRNSQP